MVSSAMGLKLGVFGFLSTSATTHTETNTNKIRPRSSRTVRCFTCIYLHAQTAVYKHLMNHSYFDRRKNPNTHNEPHAGMKMVQVLGFPLYICGHNIKSKIGHHCDGWNFFFQLSFLSSQKPRHFMYIIWINNHCTPQKHQRGTAMTKHVTVATHLKVRRTEFCSKIPSVAKIHFWLSCFSSCVILQWGYRRTTQ